MEKISRRKMLMLAGAGAAGAAAIASVPVANMLVSANAGSMTFHAEVGLPAGGKVPVYCTWVIDGKLRLGDRTGTLTTSMRAGYPELNSASHWPGFARTVHVSDVRKSGSTLQVKGTIADHSQLRAGESPTFNMLIDQGAGVGHAWFFGKEVLLRLS